MNPSTARKEPDIHPVPLPTERQDSYSSVVQCYVLVPMIQYFGGGGRACLRGRYVTVPLHTNRSEFHPHRSKSLLEKIILCKKKSIPRVRETVSAFCNDPNGIVSRAEKAYCQETKLERVLQSALTPSFDDAREAITSLLICQCREQNGCSDKNSQADQTSY